MDVARTTEEEFAMALTREHRLNFASLNCEGVKKANAYISNLLSADKCDFLLLQEKWILDSDLPRLNALHPEYLAIGKSGVDDRIRILPGRPSGGVAILYSKRHARSVRCISSDNRRICGLRIAPCDFDNFCLYAM